MKEFLKSELLPNLYQAGDIVSQCFPSIWCNTLRQIGNLHYKSITVLKFLAVIEKKQKLWPKYFELTYYNSSLQKNVQLIIHVAMYSTFAGPYTSDRVLLTFRSHERLTHLRLQDSFVSGRVKGVHSRCHYLSSGHHESMDPFSFIHR